MARDQETFDNFIHLSVAVVQSAADMIEQIGALKTMRRAAHPDRIHPREFLDLRKAVSKAVRALENYDAMQKAGNAPTTGEEFDRAARSLKSEAA